MLAIKNFTSEKINEEKLQRIAETVLKVIGGKKNIEASLVLCGDKRMKNLNKTYRKKNKTTDVLSFSAQEQLKGQKPFILPEKEACFLGEIFISVPEASRESVEYGESLDRVLARLLIHGILHLAGYDHEKNEDAARKMFKIQEEVLNKIYKQLKHKNQNQKP